VRILFVDDPDGLSRALAAVDAPVVGVDVERADAPRYFRRAALIQIGVPNAVVLIDSVALDPVPGLTAFLAGRTAVLHAIHNDLEPLRAAGVDAGSVEDTAVAAAILGLPIGLDPLLQEVLGVALSADKDRFQRADWEQRPLPDDMAAYAAGDVAHLAPLWSELHDRLAATERTAWYEEERDHVVATAFDETRDWTRTRGAGRLTPGQRAVLRSLWEERETIAREYDLAPNRVLREPALLDLAQNPAADARDLIRRNQRRGRPSRVHADRLLAAAETGATADPEPREAAGGRWTAQQRAAYDAMRRVRAERAADLGLDAGVLCPSRALYAPARGAPASSQELVEQAELRRWQAGLLADVLWEAYQKAMTSDVADEEVDPPTS
jgi:ribonuclease D